MLDLHIARERERASVRLTGNNVALAYMDLTGLKTQALLRRNHRAVFFVHCAILFFFSMVTAVFMRDSPARTIRQNGFSLYIEYTREKERK